MRIALWLGLAALLALASPRGVAGDESPAVATPATKPANTAPSTLNRRAPQGPPQPQAVPEGARSPILPTVPAGAKIAIVPIDGLIYEFTEKSLERRCAKAVAAGADVIVFEINTKGGLLTSALAISKTIKTLGVPTVAWVRDEAYSAGTVISAAAGAIVMSPASFIGDCAPISPGVTLAPTERAKALSPLLAEFDDSATRAGYEYVMFQAMCELGVEVYRVKHRDTGEERLVNQADRKVMVDGASVDEVARAARQRVGDAAPDSGAAVGSPATQSAAGVVRGFTAADIGGFMPSPTTTDEDRGQWTLVRQVHDGRTLLTLHQTAAMDLGLARGIARNESELIQLLAGSGVTRFDPDWSEGAASWLTTPWVRGLLILVMLMGVFTEMMWPGHFVAGAIAAIALLLLIISPFVVGLAEVWHIIVLFIGVVLIAIEFFAPHFGIVGIIGLVMMVVGLIMSSVPSSGSGPLAVPSHEVWGRLQQSVIFTLLGVIGSAVGFAALAKYSGRIPFARRLMLENPRVAAEEARERRGDANVSRGDAGGADGAGVYAGASGDEAIGHGTIAVGGEGVVVSPLRPSGRAQFGSRVADVVAVSGWIEVGQPVRVVEVRGNRIVVDERR